MNKIVTPAVGAAHAAVPGEWSQAVPCRFVGDDAPGAPRVWACQCQPGPAGEQPERTRQRARDHARALLRELLAVTFQLPADAIWLDDQRGRPLRAQLSPGTPAPPGWPALGLSLSHAGADTLIALRATGPVGVDLAPLPDWPRAELLRLACDYLGGAVAQSLAEHDEGPLLWRAFAAKWAAHEATLKCLGLALREWSPALAAQLPSSMGIALALPDALRNNAAAVAWHGSRPHSCDPTFAANLSKRIFI